MFDPVGRAVEPGVVGFVAEAAEPLDVLCDYGCEVLSWLCDGPGGRWFVHCLDFGERVTRYMAVPVDTRGEAGLRSGSLDVRGALGRGGYVVDVDERSVVCGAWEARLCDIPESCVPVGGVTFRPLR